MKHFVEGIRLKSATLWVRARGKGEPTRLSYQAKRRFSLKLGERCVFVCMRMHVLGRSTLPGQVLVGTVLVSSLGRWLGGWPSLSSCVSAGCLRFVMEKLFPSNPWTWLEGQRLPGTDKRKWFSDYIYKVKYENIHFLALLAASLCGCWSVGRCVTVWNYSRATLQSIVQTFMQCRLYWFCRSSVFASITTLRLMLVVCCLRAVITPVIPSFLCPVLVGHSLVLSFVSFFF